MRPRTWRTLTRIIFTVIVLFWTLFPVYLIVITALKTYAETMSETPVFIFTPTMENFYHVLFERELVQNILNSAIAVVGSTLCSLGLGVSAAYALARYKFRGKENISNWILSLRLLPPISIILPIFVLFNFAGLLDTYAGLIIIYTLFNVPLVVWLMRSFIEDIPREIEESASVDGCSPFGVFFRITLPLVAQGLVATAVLCTIFTWNEFLFAVVITSRNTVTVPPTLWNLVGQKRIYWNEIMAGSVIVMIPVLIFLILVQKKLVTGLTWGAVKG